MVVNAKIYSLFTFADVEKRQNLPLKYALYFRDGLYF
jgi:hypothetical protein